MIEIPTLETERLILRAPKFEDLESMEVFFADPVRIKFLGGPIKRGDVWRALLRTAGHWQIRGYGFGISKIEKQVSCVDTRAF